MYVQYIVDITLSSVGLMASHQFGSDFVTDGLP